MASKADSRNKELSPPPKKRKLESTTTMTSFFTPSSQKEKVPEQTKWHIIHETVLVGRYRPLQAPNVIAPPDPERAPPGPVKRTKIAAFDLDSTLIQTKSGNVFGKDPEDWRWWDPIVPTELRRLYHEEQYEIVILTNQGSLSLRSHVQNKIPKAGSKSQSQFKQKAGNVLAHFDFPVFLLASTEHDRFRKPRAGMWAEVLEEFDLVDGGVDANDVLRANVAIPTRLNKVASFFVGDAGGRAAKDAKSRADHSSSDRDLASNIGIDFKTPEEFFLHEIQNVTFSRTFEPSKLIRKAKAAFIPNPTENQTDHQQDVQQPAYSTSTATTTTATIATSTTPSTPSNPGYTRLHPLDIILFVGSPGAGKSTFYHTHLSPLGYERVNQDTLKSRDKCVRVASDFLLLESKPVVVDNTNADPDTRKVWIELARKVKVPIRCIHFTAPALLCKHNDTVRALAGSIRDTDGNGAGNAGDGSDDEFSSSSVSKFNRPNKHNGHKHKGGSAGHGHNDGFFNPENRTILPASAFAGFASRYKEPRVSEGFVDVVRVDFEFDGTDAQHRLWSQYWI